MNSIIVSKQNNRIISKIIPAVAKIYFAAARFFLPLAYAEKRVIVLKVISFSFGLCASVEV